MERSSGFEPHEQSNEPGARDKLLSALGKGALAYTALATLATMGGDARAETNPHPETRPSIPPATAERYQGHEFEAALEANWDKTKPEIVHNLQVNLSRGETYILYDTQTNTSGMLDMAVRTDKPEYISDLAGVYNAAANYLITQGNHKEWHATLESTKLGENYVGVENQIVSSQYIYALSRTLCAIANIPANERTENMEEFTNNYEAVISRDHLFRWVFADNPADKVFGRSDIKGAPKLNHFQHMQMLASNSYPASPSYNNTLRDKDMLIIGSVAEMLVANKEDPNLMPLSERELSYYRQYLQVAYDAAKKHIQLTDIQDRSGNTVKGITVDPGAWGAHPDLAYAGYTSDVPPTEADKSGGTSQTTLDISHLRRLVGFLNSAEAAADKLGVDFPADEYKKALGNQIAYKVFNGDYSNPLASNYLDGSNGWYRIGYHAQGGVGPSGLTYALVEGGYTTADPSNKELRNIGEALWTAFKDPTSEATRRSSVPVDNTSGSLNELRMVTNLIRE